MSIAWPSEPSADWWDSFDVEEDWKTEALHNADEEVISSAIYSI